MLKGKVRKVRDPISALAFYSGDPRKEDCSEEQPREAVQMRHSAWMRTIPRGYLAV
jgi:hypothetical protein